jgi:asparagine synthetase B (glutamine-hydrolysing)
VRWRWREAAALEELGGSRRPVIACGTLGGPLRAAVRRPGASAEDLAAAADRSNGWFAVLCAHEGGVRVVTDAGGSVPVFCAAGPAGFAVGTRALDVARAAGRTVTDAASLADFMSNGSVCHPYTWYEGVRVLEPGSVSTVTAGGTDAVPYWEPREPRGVNDARGSERGWGEALRTEVRAALDLGLRGAGSARVLFSGGEDSRVVAALLPRDLDVRLTTVLDARNREYRLAQRAAGTLRRPFEWVPRPPGFYTTDLARRVALTGAAADPQYVHVFGAVAERCVGVDVLLGGYLADTFFKSVYLSNVRRLRFMPETLGPPRPDTIMGLEFALDGRDLLPDLAEEVTRRRRAHQERVRALRPLTAGGWHDVWPLGPHCIDYVYHTACRAVGPRVVEPFFAHRVYRLAAAMPNSCRLERAAFRHAFLRDLGHAGWLQTSKGYRMRLGRRGGALTARAALIWRHRADQLTGRVGAQGAWTPDVVPLEVEGHLTASEASRALEALGGVLRDGDAATLLRRPGLLNAVRWRALTLAFDGSALDERIGCTRV